MTTGLAVLAALVASFCFVAVGAPIFGLVVIPAIVRWLDRNG